MVRLLFSLAAVAIAAACFAATGSAGKPTEKSHEKISDGPFADNICGIDGTSTVKGVDTFAIRDGSYKDTFEINQTFTATGSGKAIVIHVAQQSSGPADPVSVVDNGDGTQTVTFVDTFKGLPEQLRVKNGPLLSRDAGVVTQTQTFIHDLTTDEYTFVSRTLTGLHGPHPDLLSDFAVFCNVLTPALT